MRIGYLASGLFSSYNTLVWKGVNEVCRERGATFLHFSGGELESPNLTQAVRNRIFDLVSERSVDGILINSTASFHYAGAERVMGFYRAYAGLPIVSIGLKVGDWPAVMTDNSTGMRDAVLHLIDGHGLTGIAFITGPESNAESNIRLEAYKAALGERGIDFRPELVAKGDFTAGGGQACLDALLAKGLALDAVVAANDEMALGVVDRARALGIAVPSELAVVGFDDIDLAQEIIVPLSTVRQPIREQAAAACRLLIGMIEGGGRPQDLVLPTRFMRRRSCGCLSDETRRAGFAGAESPPRGALAAPAVASSQRAGEPIERAGELRERRSGILEGITFRSLGAAEDLGLAAGDLFDCLVSHIEGERPGSALLEAGKRINRAASERFTDFAALQNLVSELNARVRPLLRGDPALLATADSFWHQARVLIYELGCQSRSQARYRERGYEFRVKEASWRLILCFEIPRLIRTILEELPKIGVPSCFVCLYENPDVDFLRSRLLLAFDESGALPLPEGGLPFASRELLPEGTWPFGRLDAFFIEPLFVETESLGYIVLRTDRDDVPFEELRRQISSAFKGAILNEEVGKLAVSEKGRAAELEEANAALKNNLQKMLAIEKMASLGRLTAGLAHEMNTPLATIRAAAMEMASLVDEYGRSIGDPEVGDDGHRAIAAEMATLMGLVRRAAERTVSFVQGMRAQTRDVSKLESRDFNAVAVVRESILLLNHAIKLGKCPVSFEPSSERIMLHGIEGKLAQALTNLISNAIDASKAKGGAPIAVRLTEEAGKVLIRVQDQGTGIEKEIMPRIFDPMFTTKSMAEGTGLGLTIVYEIVTGDFGGSIEVESEPGRGAAFTIIISNERKGAADAEKVQ